jgi:hypothetical protein
MAAEFHAVYGALFEAPKYDLFLWQAIRPVEHNQHTQICERPAERPMILTMNRRSL